MASENVELVRGIYARWAEGDFAQTDWVGPEFEFQPERAGPFGDRKGGVELMAAQWRDFLGALDDVRATAEEFTEVGDRVLVLTRFYGHGKLSHASLEHMPAAAVFTVRKGKVSRLALYTSPTEAREALGLSSDEWPSPNP